MGCRTASPEHLFRNFNRPWEIQATTTIATNPYGHDAPRGVSASEILDELVRLLGSDELGRQLDASSIDDLRLVADKADELGITR